MKIVVFEAEPWEREAFDRLAREHEILVTNQPLRGEVAAAWRDAEVISVFIHATADRPALEHFEAMRLVATRSTGVDHVATDCWRERAIAVANVPTYARTRWPSTSSRCSWRSATTWSRRSTGPAAVTSRSPGCRASISRAVRSASLPRATSAATSPRSPTGSGGRSWRTTSSRTRRRPAAATFATCRCTR